MFGSELLARAIATDRARDIERAGRDARLLEASRPERPAVVSKSSMPTPNPRESRRGAGPSCEPA